MVLMFLTNWNLIFILVNFFHFLPISWATWFCNVWLLTSHWEKNKSIYAVSLNQAKHCRKHQKSWGQPKSWEVVLPNQLSRIHNHRTYSIHILLWWKFCQIADGEKPFWKSLTSTSWTWGNFGFIEQKSENRS